MNDVKTQPPAAPAAVPSRVDGRRTHEELLAAAQQTFLEQGADASLREVARRAGVSIATFYRHFATREALLETLLRQAFDTLHARAVDLLDAADPGDALVVWLTELTAAADRYDGLPAQVIAALHDPASTLHASCAELHSAAAGLLARAQHAGVIRGDLKPDELLASAYAMAWAARQTGGSKERLLKVLVEGLMARPV